jgi:HIT domain-containing protein
MSSVLIAAAVVAHAENAESRSWTRYRGVVFHGNASRSCCAVHTALGWSVTATCTTWLRSCARITSTNRSRHVADYFDLYQPERNAIQRLLEADRARLRERDPEVGGFNVGLNAGEAAGQTIFHCHVHLIPRRVGDVENPRGGVRGVVPSKQDYHP